ncbi:hypothetical protein MyNCGM121_31600 [Achromobacter xylosoxidans]
MKCQDAQYGQDRQEQRDHAGDHSRAGADAAVLLEQIQDLTVNGRALIHFTFMADHGEASVSPGQACHVNKRE